MTRSPSRSPAATSTTTTWPGATTASSLAFVSARHDGRDTDLVSDVWLCALDGSQLRPVTRRRHRRAPQALDHLGARRSERRHGSVLAATEFGADGLMMHGRNAGLWSSPGRRLRAARPAHRRRDHPSRDGHPIEATPDGVLACVERRGAVELVLVPYKNNDLQVADFAGGDRQFEGFARSQSVLVATVADPASRGELIALDLAERTERQLTSLGRDPGPADGGTHGDRARRLSGARLDRAS